MITRAPTGDLPAVSAGPLAPSPVLTAWAVAVARRHYVEGQSKTSIARATGMSRFKVARLIDHALEHGLVRVTVNSPVDLDVDLGEALVAAYPTIDQALVVRADPLLGSDPRPAVGRVGAQVLAELLRPEDVLGVAWGRTLEALVAELPSLPPCPVVQLAGAVASMASAGPQDLAPRISSATGGPCHPLYAPLVVADAKVADGLRREPALASTFALYERVTVAVVGVGAFRRSGSSLYQLLSPADRAAMRGAGVVADVAACLLDSGGQAINGLEPRMLAMQSSSLRKVRTVIAIAAGAAKAEAIRAALCSRLVSVLVTDVEAARSVLGPRQERRGGRSA